MKFSPVAIARQFLYVREAGTNSGLRVNAIQRWGGGRDGDSWCGWFVTMVLDVAFQGSSPIPRMGSCQAIYELAKAKSWLTTVPVEGDIVLYVDDNDHAHHVGLFTVERNIIAGNTSADGTSSNGDGVHEHPLTVSPEHVRYVRYPR